MDHAKRRQNMLDAAAALKELLERGLLGNFSWFEAVEVVATRPAEGRDGYRTRNIVSIYIAEEGARPQDHAEPFLNGRKQKRFNSLDGWGFGITKRSVEIGALLASIERYGRDGVWQPPGQPPLETGPLVASPPMFCPPDSRTTVALNAILKNNFWSGSYVVELKDGPKTTLTDVVENEVLIEDLSAWLETWLPMNIARAPDRLGDILLQIPSNALIAEYRRRPGMPVDMQLAWNPDIAPRPVVGEYRVEYDGLISSLARFDFPVGRATLHIPPISGDLRFSVWDKDRQLVLAATSVHHAPDGKGWVESHIAYGMDQARRFVFDGPDNMAEECVVPIFEPDGGKRVFGQTRSMVDWVDRREFKAKMANLVASKRFLQYGAGKATHQQERRLALQDLRHLIKALDQGAIYLWDPYLSANDVLGTLAFCQNTGTALRALTSAKPTGPSKTKEQFSCDRRERTAQTQGPYEETDADMTSYRVGWIAKQKSRLDSAFVGPAHIDLEFRMSWGSHGAFHDRFLIFPGTERVRTRAWSLGASINHIGGEHCIVQEVMHAEAVLEAFLTFWEQSNGPGHLVWKST